MTQNNRAVFWALFAFMAYSLSDGFRKIVVQDVPVLDVLFWVAAIGMWVSLLVAPFIGGFNTIFDMKNFKYHVAKGCFIALNTVCSLTAIASVPIMDAYTIFFLTPFVTSVLGVFLLGERIGLYRLMAIGAGFIGAFIAFRPGFEDIHPAYGYALACVFLFSFSSIVARKIGETQNLAAFAFWPFVILFFGIVIYKGGDVPMSYDISFFGWISVIVLAYGSASIALSYAFTLAPAVVVVPYQYTQIIFALGFGFFVFGNTPDAYKIAGSAIIIGSGLVLFMRERLVKNRDL